MCNLFFLFQVILDIFHILQYLQNNLSKISNKDAKFKVNVNHTLDPYTFHTRPNSRNAIIYNDITKYGFINLKLDRITVREYNEINLTNPGDNNGIWVLLDGNNLKYHFLHFFTWFQRRILRNF